MSYAPSSLINWSVLPFNLRIKWAKHHGNPHIYGCPFDIAFNEQVYDDDKVCRRLDSVSLFCSFYISGTAIQLITGSEKILKDFSVSPSISVMTYPQVAGSLMDDAFISPQDPKYKFFKHVADCERLSSSIATGLLLKCSAGVQLLKACGFLEAVVGVSPTTRRRRLCLGAFSENLSPVSFRDPGFSWHQSTGSITAALNPMGYL